MEKYKLFINGEWSNSLSGENIEVINPSTGLIVGYVPKGGIEETKLAIDAANKALKTWSILPANNRSSYLRRVYELMLENKKEIAELMTMEQGKPIREAEGEVTYAASFLEWYSEEAKRVYGDTIPSGYMNKRIMVLRQPVGVVAAITPWNFPAAMVTRKIAPALAAGCTVVLKPASQTPITAIKIMELFQKAGLPKGVINLVTGSAEDIGSTLMQDSRVKKLTFTGSTEVGKILMQQAAATVKKISLELGGHAPMLVFDDADIDKAVEGAIVTKLRNCGQTCISTNRFYIQEGIKEEFIRKLVVKLKEMKIGDGFEPDTDIGPLIDNRSYLKVKQHIEDALDKGAKLEFGGNYRHQGTTEKGGYFIEPTLITDISKEMIISKEETFGPVLPIISFKTEEEAIEAANDTNYGLAAYLFTESLSRAIRVSEMLEFGIIGINDGRPSTAQAPFGGMKESGIGREGGKYGIEEFLETKFISMEI